MTEQKVELNRGLRDVYIDKTESSFIDGKVGKLLYRGYNIHDLAEHSTFEESSYLLLHGSLPTSRQLQAFDAELKASRELPGEILQVIRLTKNAHPMDVLRTAVSALAAFDPQVADNSPESVLRKGVRLTAQVPTIVAAHARIRDGKEPVTPDPGLNHAANFLFMLFGEMPDPEDVKLIDKDLVLHAEHGINASAFTARVAASTRADFYAAITAGIAALKGPIHGGAAEAVMKMALEIGDEENADQYVTTLLGSGGVVMGFGHPVYKSVDPRSVHLKAEAEALAKRRGKPKWFSTLRAVTETEAMKQRAKKGVHPNVDFWAGASYYLLGIPDDLFISLFTMGRIPGWTLQLMEQYAAKYLIRPMLLYTGPMDLQYVPINQRG
jgi:citrate synthase